jgi:glycosyltransferase involved in cell wall biosynthesis
MKILIDGHMLGENEGGNERYIKDLSFALIKNSGSSNSIKIAVSSDYFLKQNDFSKKDLIKIKYKNNLYRLIYLSKISSSYKFDILHSTYIAPPYLSNTASIVTIHDVSFNKYPEFYSFRERFIFNKLLPDSIKKAKAIIVPSFFTKKELQSIFPQYTDKIFVIYEAPNREFFFINKTAAKSEIRNKYKISDPFILTINSKNPKKNINSIIKSFNKIRSQKPNMKLIVIGDKSNVNEKMLKNIVFFNNISDKDLNLFYNSSEFFISLSFYEGFNLPIIEALSTHALVIASDIPVNRELYKDSLIYSPLNNLREISKIMRETLLNLDKIKANKLKKIPKIVKKYSYSNSAKSLLRVYKKIIN